jgi:Mg2+/citrate symporter
MNLSTNVSRACGEQMKFISPLSQYLYLSLSLARETFVDIKRIAMMSPETPNLSVLSERRQA